MPTRTAFAVLRAYLEARASFGEGDFDTVRTAFLYRRLHPGEFLQRAGDVARFAAFVASGCLRNYIIDEKWKEHIVQFAPSEAEGSSPVTSNPRAASAEWRPAPQARSRTRARGGGWSRSSSCLQADCLSSIPVTFTSTDGRRRSGDSKGG